ncbi:MAG: hypothetical protein H6Q70_2265 [Firmicutes bacterium]|nr:hypothetical protein [Bacillota bacterium]
MKKVKYFLSTMLAVMICFGLIAVCAANESKSVSDKGMLLIVVDKSKESYGDQLRNEVYTQLKSQLKCSLLEESGLQNSMSRHEYDEISKAEQPQLLELANEKGTNQVLIVEILPIKSEFNDSIIYKAIKSEATLKVRLYDRAAKQYVENEEIVGIGTNKTYIPYTGVGKKVTVLEAVHQATDFIVQKVNQNESSGK